MSISGPVARHYGEKQTPLRRTAVTRYTLLLHYPEQTTEDLGSEALAEGMRALPRVAHGSSVWWLTLTRPYHWVRNLPIGTLHNADCSDRYASIDAMHPQPVLLASHKPSHKVK